LPWFQVLTVERAMMKSLACLGHTVERYKSRS
jgi:hypothetical protein